MNTRSRSAKTMKTHFDDTWDVPSLKGNRLKSSIIKTYSKKTPYNVVVYREHIEEDLFSEPEQKTRNHSASASAIKRKRSIKKVITRKSTCKKNKTTVSLASMSPCTVLNFTDNDGDRIGQPMSLCSIANRIDEVSCGMTARNSTLLANNDSHVDVDFVPDNISMIQGDKAHYQTIVSNEWTPVKQAIENVPSIKKVTFSNVKIGQKSKSVHFSKPTDDDNIQSILKKPYLASESIESNDQECYRDITPESCNPTKSFCGSQRRRLSYNADDTVPTCLLLDLPCSKGKKAAIWCGKSSDLIKLEELDSFPTDVLL